MINREEIQQFISFANAARDIYPDVNSDEFRKLISSIETADSFGYNKTELIYYISGLNQLQFDDNWAEPLILAQLKESFTLESFFSQLLDIEMICTEESNNKAKEIIIDRIELYFDTANFYRFRQKCIAYEWEGTSMFPKFFNIENKETLPLIDMPDEPKRIAFIVNKGGELIMDVDLISNCEDEENWHNEQMDSSESFRKQTFKEWDLEEQEDDAILELFREEEELYASCFVDGEPDIVRLQAVAPKCSKAWYMLLKMEEKEIGEWFLDPPQY